MALEPWVAKLEKGEGEAAWTLLMEQYHRLISATVRHYGKSYDDVMDMFAHVCGSLRANDFARLRKYTAIPGGRVRFTTWLVAVTRNLAIDWLRQRHGRKRPNKILAQLPPIQRDALECVFVQGYSHAEAFEVTRAKGVHALSFPEFLRVLAQAQRAVSTADPGQLAKELGEAARRELSDVPSGVTVAEVASGTEPADSQATNAEVREWLGRALETLSAEDRAAIRLYVINGLAASEVARLLGWQSAKTVYNRVYRALRVMRDDLVKKGLEPSDLG